MLAPNSTIPLFPLDIVLFPGMMLPLHIFEDRYKAMITECLAHDRNFGVILAKNKRAKSPGVTELSADDVHQVGTLAYITAVENLADGRINLMTVGQDRFVIKNVKPGLNDFLVGEVDPLDMVQGDPVKVADMANRLRPMVKQYIEHLGNISGKDLSTVVLPADPQALGFLTGAALQSPLADKQALLSAISLTALIAGAATILDREDQILAYMVRAYQAHQKIERLPFVDFSLN